jgi:MraZ protein
MSKEVKRTVFVGTFRHSVDEKKRVAIPAKWRAAASGASEFYILPNPKNCLVVKSAESITKMADKADEIPFGDEKRRAALRTIASRAHGCPLDSQGRINLPDNLLRLAGITDEAVLVGNFNEFEIWSPQRWAAEESGQDLVEAAKEMGL